MAVNKTLDFNTLQRPTIQLTMQDAEHTEIKVGTPNHALVKELQEIVPNLNEVYQGGDDEAISVLYDLAAKIISCNRSQVIVTADDLRRKYHMELEELIIFFNAYVEFLGEIKNAKN